ncbi:MAG: response regulator transcription factor [Cyanobacteria bacterium P01_A01_bin.40]
MIKVAVIDDQNTVINIFKLFFENISDILLIGSANNGQDAIRIVDEHRPDVILIDIEMPIMNGIEATRIITERFSKTKVILFTSHDNKLIRSLAIKAGADGYVSKITDLQDLDQAVYLVREGFGFFQFQPILGE